MILNHKRIVAAVLCACCLWLAGCDKNVEVTNDSSSSNSSPDYDMVEAEWMDLESDCVHAYALFLKMGSMSDDEVTVETGMVPVKDGTKTSWENAEDLNESFFYSRDTETSISVYTQTFGLRTNDVNKWIDWEVSAFDKVFDVKGERVYVEGVTWYWEWNAFAENCKLQVYSTGVTGEYTVLLAFTRQGETFIHDDIIIDERGDVE